MIIDCHNHVGVDMMFYLRGDFPYAQHLTSMVAEGRALGVTRWIAFPFITNLSLGISGLRDGIITTEGALERVPYAVENRRHLHEIYDLFPDFSEAIIPFVIVDPMREPQGQVEALRLLRNDYPFAGLKAQTTILQSPIKHLLREGRVILELAEEWDLPFLIHSSVMPSDLWAQASDILDVVEATPNVRFCLAHSLRFDKMQLDRLADLPNAWFDCSAHRIHCELAVADSSVIAPPARRFPSDYTRPEQVLLDLATAYPRKLMWGSDSPFYSWVADTDGVVLSLLSTYEDEVACFNALPPELQHLVGEANTLEFLKLKR